MSDDRSSAARHGASSSDEHTSTDAASNDDASGQSDLIDGSSEDPDRSEDASSSLPQNVIAEAMSRHRRITTLSSAGVPEWLMVEPIAAGLNWLEWHGASCRHPRSCQETPGPLRSLLKQRRKARESQARLVHDALWKFATFAMIADVREMVRSKHAEVVAEIDAGALFSPDRLRRLLLDDSEELNVQDLAAALWASRIDDSRAEELFRILPAFRGDVTHEPVETVPAPRPGPVEKPKHRDKRLQLQVKVQELEGVVARLRTDLKERAKERRASESVIASLRQEIAAAGEAAEISQQRITELEARLREIRLESLQNRRDWQQASKTAGLLRGDLERTTQDLSEIEKDRAAVVRALASARTTVETLNAQLDAIPRGREAIADWLRREEERLNEEFLTLEGGDRQRAADEKRLRRKLEQAFLQAYPDFVPPRPATIGEKRRIDFRARGGGSEVGRSCYELSLGPHRFLVDCGLAVGGARSAEDRLPDLNGLSRLDALLVTHAHTDHVGWLPALAAQITEPFPIYCTAPTAQLLPIMLRDSRNHYERAMAQEQLIRKYDPGAEELVEAYSRDDIYEVETRLREAPMSERQNIAGTDVFATYFPAGHILGAASILIEGGGRRILFSGDISSEYQNTVGAYWLPEDFERVDLLVLESTYGNRSRDPIAVAKEQLVRFVRDTVTDGVALLPSFALGRAQEVLVILARAREARELPRDLRILVDGMIKSVNDVYATNDKLELGQFQEISTKLDRELVIGDALRGVAPPTVVVTTSGMLAGGPIVEWASRLLFDPRNRMALLGYQDEEGAGGALRKAARGRPPYTLSLRGEDGDERIVQVSAPVTDIALSAHADREGLVEYAKRARPQRIVLVHGDTTAREALKARLDHDGVAPEVLLEDQLVVD